MRNLFRKLISGVAAAALAISIFPAAAFAAGNNQQTHITILGTSDMHGNPWGYSYEDDKETANNGMARLYTYIQQVRAEQPNVVLVDAGDDIQGTIMTDDIANKRPNEAHPVIAAMNQMGYDAMTLGNHEFNWGIPTMKTILSQANFPVLAANVKDASGNFVTGAGWTITERDGVKIAIIGVVTPDVPIWDGGKAGIEDCTYEAASTAVKEAIQAINGQADVIVVSAHMGLYAEFDEEGGSDSAQKILDDNPEVDVLQVAHNHVVVKQKEGNVVIGGVRNSGRDIARFDLTLDADKNVVDSSVEIVDMTGVTPSEELRANPVVAKAHQETRDFQGRHRCRRRKGQRAWLYHRKVPARQRDRRSARGQAAGYGRHGSHQQGAAGELRRGRLRSSSLQGHQRPAQGRDQLRQHLRYLQV